MEQEEEGYPLGAAARAFIVRLAMDSCTLWPTSPPLAKQAATHWQQSGQSHDVSSWPYDSCNVQLPALLGVQKRASHLWHLSCAEAELQHRHVVSSDFLGWMTASNSAMSFSGTGKLQCPCASR